MPDGREGTFEQHVDTMEVTCFKTKQHNMFAEEDTARHLNFL